MIQTYGELAAICESPKEQRAVLIRSYALDIERIIAEQVMGAKLVDNAWHLGTPMIRGAIGLGLFENDGKMHEPGVYYKPMHDAMRALAAMDKMIARGWDFEPHWNGLDFSAVEAFNHEKRLFVQSVFWGHNTERHATAISLAVALACLLEKEQAQAAGG